MKKNKVIVISLLCSLMLLAMASTSAFAAESMQSAANCQIPESGPWPPCATGGAATSNDSGCQIPESGPWPPCATSGNSSGGSSAGSSAGSDCQIPASGPWPPCATSGAASSGGGNAGGSDTCQVPESGPWPPCATNGGSSGGGAAAPGGTDSGTTPPLPPAATPPPVEEETIKLYYASNETELLGEFPLRPFNGQEMLANMEKMHESLHVMKNSLNGALDGDAAACNNYVAAYEGIMASGVFYTDIPGNWIDTDIRYTLSFIFSLDRTRPAYLSCKDSGKIDQFNYGLAFRAIEQTIEFLEPGIAAAKVFLR